MERRHWGWLMAGVIGISFIYYSVFLPADEMIPIAAPQGETDIDSVAVYVSGAVECPGVYVLPQGSRVADAVKAAGNWLPYADAESVNLAQKVSEGDHISVGYDFDPPESALGIALVNVNRATEKELETLPGVGPATARKIIEYRTENGLFGVTEDLKKVKGIGEGKFQKIRAHITV